VLNFSRNTKVADINNMEDDQSIIWDKMDRPENRDSLCDLISLKREVMNTGSNENFFNQNFCNHLKAHG